MALKYDFDALRAVATTDRQRQQLDKIQQMGVGKASREMGVNRRTLQLLLQKLVGLAARRGMSAEHDMTHAVPAGYEVRGVSTLYNADGQVSQQWVKSRLRDDDALQAMREAIEEVAAEYRGTAKPVRAPARNVSSLMACYPMGDPHIGMLALAAEAGTDFDTKIARQDLLAAASRLVEVAPASERALVINLGDYFHADSLAQLTKSGHKLDVDTRWQKVLTIGCHLMVDLISLALQKHKTVEVINAIGNHDDHSSVMLSAFLEAWFHAEPRVVVHPTVAKFHYVEFGKCLIGVTHGDTVKHMALGELMASDRPEEWGRTLHRYWYTGHIHHTSKTELRGVVVESFRTLAARDAWHTASGYRSGRDMYVIVLDAMHGEVERHRCDIRQVRDGDTQTHQKPPAG
jgi:hypothetical protein